MSILQNVLKHFILEETFFGCLTLFYECGGINRKKLQTEYQNHKTCDIITESLL